MVAPQPVMGEPALLEAVILAPAVVQALQSQLYSLARPRGGLIIGVQAGGVLHVQLASTGVGATRCGLHLNAGYVRGYSEAAHALSGGALSAVGQWLMYPDGELRSRRRERKVVRRGIGLGVIDDRRILLVVGWRQGLLTFRASVHRPGDGMLALPCTVTWPVG